MEKEKSPQLQIHDTHRGIALLRHKATQATNYIQVKQEPAGGCEERILTCLQRGNEKIQLLLVLLQLCTELVNGNPELESILGSESTEALYELFLNQFTWIESNQASLDGKELEIPFPFRQNPQKPINENGSDARTKASEMVELSRSPGKAGPSNDIPDGTTHTLQTETELDRNLREFLMEADRPEFRRLVESRSRDGEIDEEPSPDEVSMSTHLQPQTDLVTFIKGALGNEKYGDHVRKCLADKDHKALFSALSILNQEGNEIQQFESSVKLKLVKGIEEEKESESDDLESSESDISSSSCSAADHSVATKSLCEVPSSKVSLLMVVQQPDEDQISSDLKMDSHFTSKSLESFYIDRLFEASSSDYTGSSVKSATFSSETDKRNMDFEIQAVLKQNSSGSISPQSSIDPCSSAELVEAGKDTTIDNGSGTSIALEKDVPIIVELSRKMDAEPTSSEITSQISSFKQASSSQATTASEISSSTQSTEPPAPKVSEQIQSENLDELEKLTFSTVETRMKTTFEERIKRAKVPAKAFGIDVNEYLLQEIQRCYARVLQLLVRDTTALQWIQSHCQLEDKNLLTRIVKDPPMGCSQGLVSVYKYMTGLHTLARERLLTPSDQELLRLRRLKYFWTREKQHLKNLEKLKNSMEALEDEWKPKIQKLDNILDSCIEKIKQHDSTSYENLRNITRQGLTASILQEKAHQVSMDASQLKHSQTESTVIQYHHSSLSKERIWRIRKEVLESELDQLIGKYDQSMTQAQELLDKLEREDSENMSMIMQLQKDVEDTDERYEEMRITKKLKELLRNMEMAEGFKRNRAARVIQEAWRRYRMRKLRKMRRKDKLKRKSKVPRSKSRTGKRNVEDTLSEVSCATSRYSTPAFKKEQASNDSKVGSAYGSNNGSAPGPDKAKKLQKGVGKKPSAATASKPKKK